MNDRAARWRIQAASEKASRKQAEAERDRLQARCAELEGAVAVFLGNMLEDADGNFQIPEAEMLRQALAGNASPVADVVDSLVLLISAARGMPVSHDNLCQATLDHAVEEGEKALDKLGGNYSEIPKGSEGGGDGMNTNDAMFSIVATEAKMACENEPDITERIKKAMRAAKDHWMETNEDGQFRGALGGAMLASDDDDKERIKASLLPLQALAAALQGVPVDIGRALPDDPDEVAKLLPLRKLWDEVKADS